MFYLSTLQLRGIAQSVSSDVEITHAALVQELEAKSKVRIEPPAFIIGFEYKKKKKEKKPLLVVEHFNRRQEIAVFRRWR